jgi:predicted transglutaminase-like cysteine proteinase
LTDGNNGKIVALQISTSDPKKEWGDANYRALAEILLRKSEETTIYVLGSPDERARVEEFCRSAEVNPERLKPAILSLAGVISFLEDVDVLVTGDTSVKHFASAGTTRVVEIILGSADAYRTGSWKADDLVITSRELCAPCGHSELCHRATHACAVSMTPQSVAQVVAPVLSGETRVQQQARITGLKDIQVFRVDRSEGPAMLIPLGDLMLTDAALALCLERSARRLALEVRDARFDKMKFGTEILHVKTALLNRFNGTTATELRHALADGETRLRHAEGIVQSLKVQLSRLKESFQDPKRMHEMVASVIVMRMRLQKSPWTRFVAEPLVQVIEDDRSAPFVKFRKLSDAVLDLELRIETGLKLVRGLENEFENENSNKSSMGDQI